MLISGSTINLPLWTLLNVLLIVNCQVWYSFCHCVSTTLTERNSRHASSSKANVSAKCSTTKAKTWILESQINGSRPTNPSQSKHKESLAFISLTNTLIIYPVIVSLIPYIYSTRVKTLRKSTSAVRLDDKTNNTFPKTGPCVQIPTRAASNLRGRHLHQLSPSAHVQVPGYVLKMCLYNSRLPVATVDPIGMDRFDKNWFIFSSCHHDAAYPNRSPHDVCSHTCLLARVPGICASSFGADASIRFPTAENSIISTAVGSLSSRLGVEWTILAYYTRWYVPGQQL